jgi:Fur family zinc uptake transcriptional regulator
MSATTTWSRAFPASALNIGVTGSLAARQKTNYTDHMPQAQGNVLASNPLFHAPDHDHARCEADAMADAEAHCTVRGAKLTPIRRQVLSALLSGHKPLGAYDIIERLAHEGARPAPITVYRALDFLLENGLVHRITSRNAFVACIHNHAASDSVLFLICEHCGEVGEAPSAPLQALLTTAAAKAGFTPRLPVIEITGLCANCGAEAPSS